jgi:hypothetical protein
MVRHSAGMERREMRGAFWWGNMEESDAAEAGGLHGKGVYWIISLSKGQVAVLCDMTANFVVAYIAGNFLITWGII